MLVFDGLGGMPVNSGQLTALESAQAPNLNNLALAGICGLHEPIGPGITPGSGPSHLALFGYDPLKYQVGRGVLSALGIDFDLGQNDVAARGNFCTVDENRIVTDRRAGRISTEKNKELCKMLGKIKIPQVEIFVETEKEHRFVLVLRGRGLDGRIGDTDPQQVGAKPAQPRALDKAADKTARIVASFIDQAGKVLSEQQPANMILLRGFDQKPDLPSMADAYGLRAASIAGYPMYRGLGKLIGMTALDNSEDMDSKISVLRDNWEDFDFFYLHVKGTDSAGEDGDFDRKVRIIEQVDAYIPQILELDPAVVIVTGDHSTPAALARHSWHPVPVLIWSKYCRADEVERFGERSCVTGALGPAMPATSIMPVALANALKLDKFGA